MTKFEAIKIDTSFFADDDADSEMYGVFGSQSLFCYSLHGSMSLAIDTAIKMDKEIHK